jgi:hypothetical protein
MRILIAAVMSTSLMASAAMGADRGGPLAAGKPAGVKQAELSTTVVVLSAIGAVIAVAAVVAASSNQNYNSATPSTATTS